MAADYELEKMPRGIRLTTHRLVVRPFEPADIPALIEYLSSGDPMVERVMRTAPTPEAIKGYWGPMRTVDHTAVEPRYCAVKSIRPDHGPNPSGLHPRTHQA